MNLKNEALYLMNAKIYHRHTLIWSASKTANSSIDELFSTINTVTNQVSKDILSTNQITNEIAATDLSEIEKKNPGLIKSILDEIE